MSTDNEARGIVNPPDLIKACYACAEGLERDVRMYPDGKFPSAERFTNRARALRAAIKAAAEPARVSDGLTDSRRRALFEVAIGADLNLGADALAYIGVLERQVAELHADVDQHNAAEPAGITYPPDLREYVIHKFFCRFRLTTSPFEPCTCGLDAAMKATVEVLGPSIYDDHAASLRVAAEPAGGNDSSEPRGPNWNMCKRGHQDVRWQDDGQCPVCAVSQVLATETEGVVIHGEDIRNVWVCPQCNRRNSSNVGTCLCGFVATRYTLAAELKRKIDQREALSVDAWTCVCGVLNDRTLSHCTVCSQDRAAISERKDA